MRTQTFIVLLTAGLLTSCSTSKVTFKEVVGNYYWDGYFELGSTMLLKSDSTFIYNWQMGLMAGQTKGRWNLKGNKLILNSENQPSEIKFTVDARNDSASQNITLKVKDENGHAMPFASCMVYSNQEKYSGTTDSAGMCVFDIKQVDKIEIGYVGYEPVSFIPPIQSGNYFEFQLKRHEEYEYFTNRKWIVKKHRLYDKEIKIDRFVKHNYYKRIK